MMSEQIAKRIPYGSADYGRMRRDNSYYVDKTHFIPLLAAQPYFVFLIRPRRFGKTLWLSLLQHYYDINRAEQFEELFAGTWIGDHPTAERNNYLREGFQDVDVFRLDIRKLIEMVRAMAYREE